MRGKMQGVWLSGILLAVLGCQSQPTATPSSNTAPVVQSSKTTEEAASPHGRACWQSPERQPLWMVDFEAWAKDPTRKEKQYIQMAGGGMDENQARRKARDDAVAALKVPPDWVSDGGTFFVQWYSDGWVEVRGIYQYAKPSPPQPFSAGVEKLCADLLDGLKTEKAQQVKTIVVGRFLYENTRFVSQFSDYLATEMLTPLQKHTSKQVMGREALVAMKGDAAASKIIDGPQAGPSGGDASMALLTGHFWPSAGDARTVRVQATLEEPSSGLFLHADAELSPPEVNVQVEPSESEKAQTLLNVIDEVREKVKINADEKQNFKVLLWLEGAKQVWEDGEELVVHFRSEKDCYLNLFHFGSDGTVQLLYPNHQHEDSFVKAGTDYSIPEPGSVHGWTITFKIAPPYGTDVIQAVATCRQTPALYKFRPDQDSGLRSLDEGVRGIVVKQKEALADIPGDEKAEARVTYTTVPAPAP